MALHHQGPVGNTAEGHFCPGRGGLGLVCVKSVFFVRHQPAWTPARRRCRRNALKVACSGKLGAHTMALFLLDIVLPPRLFIAGTKISLDKS